MPQFTVKKIGAKTDTIGSILRIAREFRHLSISHVSRVIGISVDYLEAIETNKIEMLPAGLYRKNYIRRYAKYLEVEEKIKDQLENIEAPETIDPFAKKIVTRRGLMVFPKIIRNSLVIMVFLAFALYLALYLKNILSAPHLEITYPEKNITTSENSLIISGKTSSLAQVEINGEETINNNGNFTKEIILKQGLNSIIIKAKKKHSREASASRQILLQ